MVNDINYFQGVVDTGKLVKNWLAKDKSTPIESLLIIIENHLENKFGPFSSKLSDSLEVNQKLTLKSPNSYWNGVKDTLDLIRNFQIWKIQKNSNRHIENFLDEMVHKSQLKLIPHEDSRLLSELGISFSGEDFAFESDFSINLADAPVKSETDKEIIHEQETESEAVNEQNVIPESNPINVAEEEVPLSSAAPLEVDPKLSESETVTKETISQETEEESSPEPISASEESLITAHSGDVISSKKDVIETDYLRSALDELNKFSSDSDSELDEIEIKVKDSMFWTPSESSKKSETKPIGNQIEEESIQPDDKSLNSLEDDKLSEDISLSLNKSISSNSFSDHEDESKLLSSSLREALKMLRDED